MVIPARMASTRLPGKPLADLDGKSMIVRVMECAMAANIGPVVVAAGEEEIVDEITKAGGKAVLTDPDLASGSDRVFAALNEIDPDANHDAVINLQGDIPLIGPEIIKAVLSPLASTDAHMATLVAEITDPLELSDPHVVKAAVGFDGSSNVAMGLYFSRAPIPAGDGPHYHHIGIYAFRREALARFVALPPGVLETRESWNNCAPLKTV